jgi:hypothetical protein
MVAAGRTLHPLSLKCSAVGAAARVAGLSEVGDAICCCSQGVLFDREEIDHVKSEQRRTRESLTRALVRIAARIAEAPTQRVEWYDHRRYKRDASTVTAIRLWVAGSYARGAQDCGDLDLVLEATFEGAYPPTSAIKNALLGRVQDASLFIGTPEKNSANIAFPEARLVWDRESPDWNANLAAIRVDPTAVRFSRPTDRLPIRPEQLSADKEQLERLLALGDERVLTWRFVDESEITVDSSGVLNAGLQRINIGVKTREALNLAISHFGSGSSKPRGWTRLDLDRLSAGLSDKTSFWFDGTLVLTGAPQVPIDRLDVLFCDRLAIVPHRSRRGPNGIWIITRGPEHPLVKSLADLRAFYVTCEGTPFYYEEYDDAVHEAAAGVDLFLNAEDADAQAESERDFVSDDEEVSVASAAGTELLSLIAGCDLVGVDGERVALSSAGEHVIQGSRDGGRNPFDPEPLIAALRGQHA